MSFVSLYFKSSHSIYHAFLFTISPVNSFHILFSFYFFHYDFPSFFSLYSTTFFTYILHILLSIHSLSHLNFLPSLSLYLYLYHLCLILFSPFPTSFFFYSIGEIFQFPITFFCPFLSFYHDYISFYSFSSLVMFSSIYIFFHPLFSLMCGLPFLFLYTYLSLNLIFLYLSYNP
ncbi:hypothetical protein FOCC_FOCC016164 [Frankliniella occidentalis]|nr:hypothetical protein FOCC_FOCC016164 [Frankliniella occidentalis]